MRVSLEAAGLDSDENARIGYCRRCAAVSDGVVPASSAIAGALVYSHSRSAFPAADVGR